jgi:hypothetical protein
MNRSDAAATPPGPPAWLCVLIFLAVFGGIAWLASRLVP